MIATSEREWEVVIGIEVHAQISSSSKLFSRSSTTFGSEPNQNVALFDAGIPGTLPSLNKECVNQVLRTALSLDAKINRHSRFERKHYFYPDLPKGYQISQTKYPLVGTGKLVLFMGDNQEIEVGIERISLEQDAGKLTHDKSSSESLIDLNRAGIGLMEIVSSPSLRSSDEAKAYLSKLRMILRYIGACDGDMEKGSMRADINVSVRRTGEPLGTRCEIKNVNSLKFVKQAIKYEAQRQIEVLENNGTIEQETRLFDPITGKTRTMRSKEKVHDYRYIPDPDLLELVIEDSTITRLRCTLPELPDAKRKRFIKEYEISSYDATLLTMNRETADYYEAAVKECNASGKAKLVANWITGDVAAHANTIGIPIWQLFTPKQVASIVELITEGVISGKVAKKILALLTDEHKGSDPRQLVEELRMHQIIDTKLIEEAVEQVITREPIKAAQAITKPAIIGWFVGQVLKETAGKSNPETVTKIVAKKISKHSCN